MTSKLPKVGTSIFAIMSALANEHGAINLSQGFPNFDCSDGLKLLVENYLRLGYNQYAPMPGVLALRERVAEKIHRLYGVSANPDTEITITAGATQALFTAITALVRTGDEVILVEPAYDCYRPAVELCGGIPVIYELTAPDYAIDWRQFQRKVTRKTRMIIVNTPHNPTGKIFKNTDWIELQRIVEGTEILVMSDEAYEHLVFDGQKHESILRYPALENQRLTVFSFGKTLHTTGWKLGCVVASPEITREFRKVHQFNVFSVNTPMQHAVADYLEMPDTYLGLPDFYQQKRDFFLQTLEGARFKPIFCEGTYFQLLDYSAISEEKDMDFVRRLTVERGLAAIPVSVFYSGGRDEKVIRVCFAKTEETLARAGEVLRAI